MSKEDIELPEEDDYPTDYKNAEAIEDAEDWLEARNPEDVASDLSDLHAYQIEWLGYACDDMEKQAVLRGELERRDHDITYMNGGTTSSSSNTTSRTKSRGNDVWDSGLEIIDNFKDLAERELGARSLEQYAKKELGIEKNKVILSEEVRKITTAIQKKTNQQYGGNCEFGVLFKGEWTDEGFVVKPDYVIPEQKVSRAHIDYEEDLKKYRDEGYIVNVHSHPWSTESASFSGTDDDHINSHFDMAVLYGGKAETFADAVANVELDSGTTARINPEVEVRQPEEELPEVEGMDNVETKKRSTGKSKTTKGSYRKGYGHRYPKGSYERYKRNSGEDGNNLPESPDEVDDNQRTFVY